MVICRFHDSKWQQIIHSINKSTDVWTAMDEFATMPGRIIIPKATVP